MKQEDWITLTLWKFLSLVVWKGGSYTARIFLWHILTPIWLAYETLCFFIVIVCFFKTVFISLALYELMFDLHLSDTVTMRFRSMILDRMCGSCGGWIFFLFFSLQFPGLASSHKWKYGVRVSVKDVKGIMYVPARGTAGATFSTCDSLFNYGMCWDRCRPQKSVCVFVSVWWPLLSPCNRATTCNI